MENAQSNNEASSGTSALDDGLGSIPTDEQQLTNALGMLNAMVSKYVRVCQELAAEKERADYAWRNTKTIEAARQEEMRKRDAAERALDVEVKDADELLKLLRLDPEIYRTDCGYINLPKVRAALANPDDYPMMPNVDVTGASGAFAAKRPCGQKG